MGYRFLRHKHPADEIRRVALEQVSRAAADVSDPDLDTETRIHSLRKRFKKLRALLRLTRGVDSKFAAREGARFRKLGQKLSALRDQDVLLQTLKSLSRPGAPRPVSNREIKRLQQSLHEQQTSLRRSTRRADPLRTIELELQSAKESLLDWRPAEVDFSTLLKEFLRTYARGRRALRRATDDPTSERMHELRKRTKDFGHQLALFREFWTGSPKRTLARAEEAGLLLGRDHDLALLAERVDENIRGTPDNRDLKRLRKRIRRSRTELDAECLDLCTKLYRRDRKDVRRKLSSAETVFDAAR